RRFGCRFDNDRGHTRNELVETCNRDLQRREAVEQALHRWEAPDKDKHREDDPGGPGARAMPGSWRGCAALGATAAAADNVAPMGSCVARAGCQIRRKPVSAAIETSAETTSTSSGPM